MKSILGIFCPILSIFKLGIILLIRHFSVSCLTILVALFLLVQALLCLDSSNIKSYVKMYDVLQTLCIIKTKL